MLNDQFVVYVNVISNDRLEHQPIWNSSAMVAD